MLQPPLLEKPRRRVRVLVCVGLAVLLVAGGWSIAWLRIADNVRDRVDGWIAARRAEGLQVDYKAITVTGYPLRWHVVVTYPNMAGAGPTAWAWQGHAVEADLAPWKRREVPLSFPGDQRFSVGRGDVAETWTLKAAHPEGRAGVDERGRLDTLALDLGDVTLRRASDPQPTHADHFAADAKLHRTPEGDFEADAFDLTLVIDNATLSHTPSEVLGTQVPHAELSLSFKGRLPGGALPNSIAAWRDEGGTIDVNRAAVTWGPVDADGSGTLALDGQNRPIGAFTARWKGFNETIDTLQSLGKLKPFAAAGLKIALRSLARANHDAPDEVKIPLSAQDGKLFVAGIPLLPVPELKFE